MSDHKPTPFPIPSADADLSEFGFIPLEIQRLRQSKAWLVCKRRPELTYYLLNLWMRVWHEVPAGSIENDEDVIADAANCDPKQWPKYKSDILRGWVAFNGRLYHPFLSGLVIEKWEDRLHHRWLMECDRIRKQNKRREKQKLEPLPFPPEPERTSAGKSESDKRTSAGNPTENALKGEGEGKGKGESSSSAGRGTSAGKGTTTGKPSDALKLDTPQRRIADRFFELRSELWPTESAFPAPALTILAQAEEFLGADAGLEPLIVEVLERTMRTKARDGDRAPGSLKAYSLTLGDAIRNHRKPARLAGDETGTATQQAEQRVLTATEMTPRHWRLKLDDWTKRHRSNPDRWTGPGAVPGLEGCLCPAEIQREFGFTPFGEQAA